MTKLNPLAVFRRAASEFDHCVALVGWMRLARLTFIHVPNETSTTKDGRATLKWRLIKQAKIGVQPEFPDYVIFDVPPLQPTTKGVVIEMKRPGEKPTPGQLLWLYRMDQQGYVTAWFDSSDAAIKFLQSLGFKGGRVQ